MIRIAERSPRARAWSYRARLAAYYGVERVGRWMRRRGAVLAWWGGERAHALATGRAVRR